LLFLSESSFPSLSGNPSVWKTEKRHPSKQFDQEQGEIDHTGWQDHCTIKPEASARMNRVA